MVKGQQCIDNLSIATLLDVVVNHFSRCAHKYDVNILKIDKGVSNNKVLAMPRGTVLAIAVS